MPFLIFPILIIGCIGFFIYEFLKPKNNLDYDLQKLKGNELKKAKLPENYSYARAQFEMELMAIKNAEKLKRQKYAKIDFAWKLACVGLGMMLFGVTENAMGFFGALGLALLAGGATGWVGSLISTSLANADEKKNAKIVKTKELISAPIVQSQSLNDGRSDLVKGIIAETATSLQKLSDTSSKLRHSESIDTINSIVATGKRLMGQVAAMPEKLNIAQRVFTYYCPETLSVAEGLIKLENEPKPDGARIIATQNVLKRIQILFESTELELKEDDAKELDINLKLLEQSLQSDIGIKIK